MIFSNVMEWIRSCCDIKKRHPAIWMTLTTVALTAIVPSAANATQVIPPASGSATTPVPPTASAAPEIHGDWVVLCVNRENLPPCEIVQTARRKDNKDQILRISIAASGRDDRYGIQFQVPLNIRVQGDILVRLGENNDLPGYRITRCETDGCYVDRVVVRADLEPFFSAQRGLLAVADRTGQPIIIPISFNGFADAMKAMTERNKNWAATRKP